MPNRITQVIVNLAHYRHNLSHIRSLVSPETKVMAVVKANAYGHGLEVMGRTAAEWGCDYLGVACLGEAQRLRNAAITTPCLLLSYLDNDSMAEAVELGVTVTVMDSTAIDSMQKAAQQAGVIAKVHLKIDTGMHRAGCRPEETVTLAEQIVASPHLDFEGVYTHFAESEDKQASFTHQQLSVFQQSVAELEQAGMRPPLVHAANSAATIDLPEAHFDMVRTGILSYGLNPFEPDHEKFQSVKASFKPVLEVVSRVAYIRHLVPGDAVGYNRRWVAARDSVVALVPIGYGDGYRRTPSQANYMLVRGQKAPIVGSVSMDQTVVDVTDIGEVKVGDAVVIIGELGTEKLSVDTLAKAWQTINYEVVVSLRDRLVRVYTET